MELVLFRAAFLLHTSALALAFGFLLSRRESLSRWMWRLLGVSLAFQLGGFALRLAAFWSVSENVGYLPVHSFFGVLQWLSLALAATFFVVEARHRLHILGAFVLPWSWLASLAAQYADPSLTPLAPALRSHWMNLHPIALMGAYAVLANAFGVGVALLVQERQVKSRSPGELCFRLPSIEELDALHAKLILASLPLLTAGILMGVAWANASWGRLWGWDAKETWAAITWLLYATFLATRLPGLVRGRRSVYVSMIGFASVLFTFFGVSYVSRMHGFLVGG